MSASSPLLAFLAFCCLVLPLVGQQPAEAPAEIPEWQRKYENLSSEDQESYLKAVSEASRLFNQKRIFEALNSIYDAEKFLKQNPGALNLKGACYVEFRDFEQARECFEEAIAIDPRNVNVLFNMVEIEFVTTNWEACVARIDELMSILPEEAVGMRRLLEFKLLLSNLKLGKIEEATALANKYDFSDDSPYYYYANASMAYYEDNIEEAESWIASARRVFRNPEMLNPWQDTLIEFGYIKSFYGDDLEVAVPELP